MSYVPKVDDVITLNLPDETTRARIVRLVSATAGIAELLNFTTQAKSHPYRKGDLVPCRFARTAIGLPGWIAIAEAELEGAAKPEEVPHEPSGREATYADIFGPMERSTPNAKKKAPRKKSGGDHAAASG